MLASFTVSALPSFAEGETMSVSSYEDLLVMKQNPYGSYELANNIDLKGVLWEPFEFHGSLDGNGYAIININVGESRDTRTVYDANLKTYDAVCSGFFSVLEDASIRNIGLWGISISMGGESATESMFGGLLAGYAYNTSVENCQLNGEISLTSAGHCIGAAGVFGFSGENSINSCHIESELVIVDTDIAYKDEQFLGGVYSFGYGTVTNNYVRVNGYDSDHGYVHNGGLVGCFMYYNAYSTGYTESVLNNNYVAGHISFFEDNADRRAYCDPICGELMNWVYDYNARTSDFSWNEVYDYSKNLTPHCNCGASTAEYDVSARNGKPGYHLSVCTSCGYQKKTGFTEPLPGVFTDNKFKKWQDPLVGCTDLLVISSHADDEQLFFAGILTYYAQVRNMAVQVVYGTNHYSDLDKGVDRFAERENGLWDVGITNFPGDSGWGDYYSENMDQALAALNYYHGLTLDDVVDWIRDTILLYKPQVVITHDVDGEYGHGFHQLMAYATQRCLEKYSDQFPFLKKVYLHLWKENKVSLTFEDQAFGELDGLTPFQVAQRYGFSQHYSQHYAWFYDWIYYGFSKYEDADYSHICKASEITMFSPMQWGLIYGDASLDVNKNDFFEGLKSWQVQEEEARKAEEERIAAEKAAAEEAERQRILEEQRAAEALAKRKKAIIIISSAAVLAVAVAAVCAAIKRRNNKRRKK